EYCDYHRHILSLDVRDKDETISANQQLQRDGDVVLNRLGGISDRQNHDLLHLTLVVRGNGHIGRGLVDNIHRVVRLLHSGEYVTVGTPGHLVTSGGASERKRLNVFMYHIVAVHVLHPARHRGRTVTSSTGNPGRSVGRRLGGNG